jgi:hypothetical protein
VCNSFVFCSAVSQSSSRATYVFLLFQQKNQSNTTPILY